MLIEEKNINDNIISEEIIDFLEKGHKKFDNTRKNPFDVSINLYKLNKNRSQYFLKKILEKTATLVGLAFISPVLLITAAAIKLESEGPVFFKQKRIGQHGKEFYICKFRSMYKDAESKVEELKKFNQTNEFMFKMFDDPRITKVGKFIRKYSIDELPQLFNVLKGEMSLVGFRPPLPSEVKNYKDSYYVRFAMMPGLTGPWQVNGRSKIKKFEDVVNLEYEYSKNWSLLKDFYILMKTIPVVLFGKDTA